MAATNASEQIRVNAIAPALAATPMSARAANDAAVPEFVALRRPLTSGTLPVEYISLWAVWKKLQIPVRH